MKRAPEGLEQPGNVKKRIEPPTNERQALTHPAPFSEIPWEGLLGTTTDLRSLIQFYWNHCKITGTSHLILLFLTVQTDQS